MTINMRVEQLIQQDTCSACIQILKDYSKWLLSIGDVTAPSAVKSVDGIVEIPSQMICSSKEELESMIYDKFLVNYNDMNYLSRRSIMSSNNDIIQQCNFDMIDLLPGETVVRKNIDECVEEKA